MTARPQIVQVAVPVPLRHQFDYLFPFEHFSPLPGMRVRVPFGKRRTLIGVITAVRSESEISAKRLKPVAQILDKEPLFPSSTLRLLEWAADYYHHPIGEVIAAALPTYLKARDTDEVATVHAWSITADGVQALSKETKRAPVQQQILKALHSAPNGLDARALRILSARWQAAIKALVTRGWATVEKRDCLEVTPVERTAAPLLADAQAQAIRAITAAQGFSPFLLYGVTGSGKTEVYLRVMEQVLAAGRQVLLLVPEIGLTPQLVTRFRQRFDVPLTMLHSNLADQQRACGWLMARAGKAQIVIGTRSAVFTPLPRLGLIIIDEEHDPSYKQQDGFRYSARDIAMMRANRELIPIVLGSATPSLETLNRVRSGAYTQLVLPHRAGGAELPIIELLDMRKLPKNEGLSPPLRIAIQETLRQDEQVLLFLNRRGFAPIWMCYECDWVASCRRCDARLTFHRASANLRCHHCGAEHRLPDTCPTCGTKGLHALGEGTERIETALKQFFPDTKILRIDRDTTRAKGSLEEKLERVRSGDAQILIGTQMLSKGHDFPNVTLVGVLNADHGLYGGDFRSAERLVQQIVQVSGRAGRAAKPGRVLIQTHYPSHPVFAALKEQNYSRFADYELTERQETGYPPFSHVALLRAESPRAEAALSFLRNARAIARRFVQGPEIQIMEPVPSPMERRAGRYRAQLLVQSAQRGPLHSLLNGWLESLSEQKSGKQVRWSIDVDPVDLY